MRCTIALFVVVMLSSLCSSSLAQIQSAFPSLWYPRSLTAGAMGEDGVVSRDPMDAMQYNPANLARAHGVAFSVFTNPYNLSSGWVGHGLPLTSMKIAANLGKTGTFGLEYSNWTLGEFVVTSTTDPDGSEVMDWYERSIAATFAVSVGSEIALGAQMRYAWEPFPQHQKVNELLFGLGLSYDPEFLSRRMNLGFSLVNFGASVKYPALKDPRTGESEQNTHGDPPPAQMHLGIRGAAIANESFDLDLMIGVLKPFTKYSAAPEWEGQSAFSSLFSDWEDFPRDVTCEAGLGYIWHPVSLGADISFIQEMYLGYFSSGPAEGRSIFLTHGAKIGLQGYGLRLTAGYAGRWHNFLPETYLAWNFPWETFQISVSSDMDLFGSGMGERESSETLHRIILSAGYTYGIALGKMDEQTLASSSGLFGYSITSSLAGKSTWSLGADFYLNEKSALVSSLAYARFTQTTTFAWQGYGVSRSVLDLPIETVSLESGFRYHPIRDFHPFFVQASLGIIRMNPVQETAPRYMYQTFDRLVVGSLFEIDGVDIVVIPRIGLRTLWLPEHTNAGELGGYHQFEAGVNVGYIL
jgi:hypothetical protein